MSIDAIPEFNENELETILFVGHDITEAKRIELEILTKTGKLKTVYIMQSEFRNAILPDNNFIREYLPKSLYFINQGML